MEGDYSNMKKFIPQIQSQSEYIEKQYNRFKEHLLLMTGNISKSDLEQLKEIYLLKV